MEANYRGSGNYFPGKVVAARPDGTYDIGYDDSDAEDGIKRSYLRVQGASNAAPGGGGGSGGGGDDGTPSGTLHREYRKHGCMCFGTWLLVLRIVVAAVVDKPVVESSSLGPRFVIATLGVILLALLIVIAGTTEP